ncbi:MAG: sugar phosphate isomerase/epimerase [Clostridiales bacterium]|nr:sugar phosphate isomerase/epimerase [Clostridiales bacterium]
MILGAQLYTVRDKAKTPGEIRSTFEKLAAIGYEAVQISGIGPIEAKELAKISKDTNLPITSTHVPFDRIVNDTEALIEEHKTYGAGVIGLGYLPNEFHGSAANLEKFFALMEKPFEKIKAAGLDFSYHNHAFEFDALPDSDMNVLDIMLERKPEWQFILDTYWIEYAGKSAIDYIKKAGGKRLKNIHYKDMANDEKHSICACGDGVLDFGKITDVCRAEGVINVLVEQDNAADFGDSFEQAKRSFDYLRPIVF